LARENFGVRHSFVHVQRQGEGIGGSARGGGRNVSAGRRRARQGKRVGVSARGVSALGVRHATGAVGSGRVRLGASPYLFNRARHRNRFAILAGGNKNEKREHADTFLPTLKRPPLILTLALTLLLGRHADTLHADPFSSRPPFQKPGDQKNAQDLRGDKNPGEWLMTLSRIDNADQQKR
jgi:hypothetical protein